MIKRYVCDKCGDVVEENELLINKELVAYGDTFGYEEFIKDCSCGGSYKEGSLCCICESWHTDNDVYDDVCVKCLKDGITVENTLEYSDYVSSECPHSVPLNPFLAQIFTPQQIETLLKEELKKEKFERINGKIDIDEECKKFCLEDEWDFAEWLKEKQNLNHY